MPKPYVKTIGRICVIVTIDGAKAHSYAHGASIAIRDGWNDGRPFITNTVSVEEMRDLRYLLDRAIAAAESV